MGTVQISPRQADADDDCKAEVVDGTGDGTARSNFVRKRRETQKNYRKRSKERTLAIRSLLTSTQEKLQEAERQKNSLLSRNSLLESLLTAQARRAAGPSCNTLSVAIEKSHRWQAASHPHVVKTLLLPRIKLTCWGGQAQYITPDDVTMMPLATFVKLYSAALGRLRSTLQAATVRVASEELMQATLEVLQLYLCFIMCCPANARHLALHSMVDGTCVDVQPQSFTAVLEMLALSEGQAQDVLAIRDIFARRCGHLVADRTALLQRMSEHSHQLNEMRILAAQLQANITETHDGYLQHVTATFLGIYTAWQAAVVFVASYPLIPNHLIGEALTRTRGEPSFEAIYTLQTAPRRLHLTWNHLSQYTSSITTSNMFTSVPFLPTVSHRPLCS